MSEAHQHPPIDGPGVPDEAWELGAGEIMTALGPKRLATGEIPQFETGYEEPDDETFTADTLDRRPVPTRRWHADGLIPGRTVTLLAGDGGVGKSTLGLQLAVASVAEMPWLGKDVAAGRVLYLSAEDDQDELHRRLDAISVHYRIGLDRLAGLRIWPLAERDALLVTGTPGRPLERTELWHDLERVADHWRPSLIVLDSAADFYAGNENDRSQVRQFVAMLRQRAIRSDAAVLLLSHPSLSGLNSGSGTSGSTAWSNSVRSRLYLSAPKDDDPGSSSDIRTLAVRKANYGPAGIEYRLRWSAGAFVNEDIGATPAIDKHVAADRIDQQFLGLLDAFEAQKRRVGSRPGPGYAPAEFEKAPDAKGTTKRGFEAAMHRLFAAGAIVMSEDGPPSKRRSRIARKVAP